MSRAGLEFGIYPLGVAGTPQGLAVGPPDDFRQIRAALADLGERMVPRTYLVDMEPGGEQSVLALTDHYRHNGVLGHVTLGCLRDSFELDRWVELVRTVVGRYGAALDSLQITNEPNLSFMDGAKPYVVEALVHGVIAAKEQACRLGIDLDVGFGSVPNGPVAVPTFWRDVASIGGSALRGAVDFVAHNFYVDVFEDPVPHSEIPDRVAGLLHDLRLVHLTAAGIPPTVPIRITENGWPTGTNPLRSSERTYERQADVLEAVIRAVDRCRVDLNISHYMLFGLRDADSSEPDLFHQFGITRDDYTPKPAYAMFKTLVAELTP